MNSNSKRNDQVVLDSPNLSEKKNILLGRRVQNSTAHHNYPLLISSAGWKTSGPLGPHSLALAKPAEEWPLVMFLEAIAPGDSRTVLMKEGRQEGGKNLGRIRVKRSASNSDSYTYRVKCHHLASCSCSIETIDIPHVENQGDSMYMLDQVPN